MAEQDEFAQTRGADDLFDDEIIPIAGDQETQHVAESHVDHEQHAHTLTNTASVDVATASPQPVNTSRRHRGGQGRGSGVTTVDGGRGRGRGRGRGGRGSADVATEAVAAAAAVEPPKASNGTDATEKKDGPTGETTGVTTGEETQEGQVEEKPATTKPDPANARVLAVRGDRSGTGGIKKVTPIQKFSRMRSKLREG